MTSSARRRGRSRRAPRADGMADLPVPQPADDRRNVYRVIEKLPMQPELESKDALKRHIDAAAKYVALDYLCLSPQRSFASSHHGNKLAPDLERRKSALVAEVATEVWGGI